MACFPDASTGALRTMEVHRMPPETEGAPERHAGEEASSLAGTTPELEDILQGCMIQKSRLIQIHAVDLMTRSFSLTYLQTVLRGPAFPYPEETDGEVNQDESRFVALDDERAMGFPLTDLDGEDRSEDLVSPFALLSGVVSGTVGGSFFAYPCVYSRIADLPSDVRRKASSIFAHLRSEKRYRSVLRLVEQVPSFVLEQLRLRLPPTAQLLPDS